MAPSAAARDRSGPNRLGRLAAVVLPAALLAVAGWLRRWTTDDAFINYRIVRMLVEGHGPVFNVGQRVEAYTSPLWLAVLTVGDLLMPLRLEYVSVVCSLALIAVGMVALGQGAVGLLGRPTDRTWVPLGSLVLLGLAPMWDFSTAGLEFGLTVFWIGGVTWVLSRWATADRPVTAGEAVFVGLGPLIRPDMTLYSVVIILALIAGRWSSESHRDRLRLLAAAVALPVLYEVFRMAYYGNLVPNTALAKAADNAHWEEGFAYLVNLFAPYYLLVPMALIAGAAVVLVRPLDRRRRLALAVLPAAGALHALTIVRAGGDYMHARLLLPSLVAVLAPVTVVPLRRPLAPLVAAIAAWAVIAAVGLRMTEPVSVGRSLIANGRQAGVGPLANSNPVTLRDQHVRPRDPISDTDGLYAGSTRLPQRVRPGLAEPVVMLAGIGAPGYSLTSRAYVVDRLGLADALTARFEVTRRGFVGHEKPIPIPWLAARVTDDRTTAAEFGGDGFATPLYRSPASQFDRDVAAARRAMDCAPLRRLRDATEGRLTIRRALSNLWRAPRLTFLRVPPDPNEAADELC